MKWPVTADSSLSIREAIGRIERSESGGIVLVDDEHRLVGTATATRLRRQLFEGVSPDTGVSTVVDTSPVVVESDGTTRPYGDADDTDERAYQTPPTVAPVIDDDDRVVDVTTVGEAKNRSQPVEHESNGVETVLVVGGAGYLGSVLCRQLLANGFHVRILDPMMYGDAGIVDLVDSEQCSVVRDDARSVETVLSAIDGVDAVVHLGGIVGDPASEISPKKTLEYNLHSTQLLASLCKYHGIDRFVFASTCSVYGRAGAATGRLSEESALNPVSLYARLKIQSERVLRDLADEHFSPTILRMATVYGQSPRMRFDLVGNILPAKAHTTETIPVFGGEQYRPNVHVEDAARAYVTCLNAPLDAVADTVYNVGSNQQNYRIDELATIVADCFPDASIEYHDNHTDERSYRVEFEKIRTELGFEPERSIRDHCLELRRSFEAGAYDEYTSTRYSNYETLARAPSYEETAAVLEPPSSGPSRPAEELPSNEI
ncbi:NAD-dependent epimerase/dehydratase family protein [Natronorubrum daqingense]|uniref:NAD-dependent dehydratase n=1 Tax=Natronorubrum daqingense TaxID=588898 RepID=A0A1N7FHM0_9EURY|nr:NAD-dependent epimerase/dehydratase family protein [Natronorubrum daqingense]APX98448.1 NAD-dependent dehydratase [Natronorubrum daqingense]SIR99735.1 Nucleoside-diphosphate-sugar epimerase [Natronorubrum daqingense]